jgi:PAS domain S-box-containing protein
MAMAKYVRRGNWGLTLAAALLTVGSILLFGGFFVAPQFLIHWLPEYVAVETQLTFACLGAAILLRPLDSPAARRARHGLTLAAGAIAGLALLNFFFELPLLQAAFAALPGRRRMLPLTAVGLLTATAILLLERPGGSTRRYLGQQSLLLLLWAVLFVGSISQIINGVLGFDLLEFQIYHFTPSWLTLLGLALLATALALVVADSPSLRGFYRYRQDRQAFALGAVLLLLIASVSWLIGASVFASQTVTMFKGALQTALQANSQTFVGSVEHAIADARQVVALRRLDALLDRRAAPAELQAELQNALNAEQDSGAVAMWLLSDTGKTLASVGERPSAASAGSQGRVRIGGRSWLFWQEGFRLEVSVPIVRGGYQIAELIAQFRLLDVDATVAFGDGLGASGEMVVCALAGPDMDCFPTRLKHESFRVPQAIDGRALPMAYALAGGAGLVLGRDYRNQMVIAAYAPLAGLGLGMVQKVDFGELYVALRHQLWLSAALIGALILAGAVFLYRRVRPAVRKLAETSLHLEEAQRVGHMASWQYDVASQRFRWSRDAWQVLNLAPEVALDTLEQVFAWMAPEDRARVRQALDAALSGNGDFAVEHTYLLGNGERRAVRVQGKVFFTAEGWPQRMVGLTQDITARHQAEERLRQSEAMLTEAERIGHLGSWEWEIAGDRQVWSDESFRIFGFAPGTVQPSSELFLSLLVDEDRPRLLELVEQIIAKASPASYQVRIRRPNGEIRHIYCNAEVRCDADGKVLRLVGTNLDISEQVEAQTRVKYLARLYAILSKCNQAIIRIRDSERLLLEICRIAVEEGGLLLAWVGRSVGHDIVPVAIWGHDDGYVAAAVQIFKRLHAGSGPTGKTLRQGSYTICDDIASDPGMVPWRELALARGYRSSAAFPIREQGELVGTINFYAPEPHFFPASAIALLDDLSQDISFALDALREKERRQLAESELQQLNEQLESRVVERTRALEDANNELESFSYSVSHDLRAPLRSIDGFSQILLRRYHEQLDDTGRDYLERVRRASQRMGQLIDDLLALSRVTRGTLRRENVDLSLLARQVIDELARAEPERLVRVSIQPGLRTYGDPGLLRVALDNLLGNAWKFTRHTAAAEIDFSCQGSVGQEVYVVRDNGAGFDPAYAKKLFQVFQRLHGQEEFEGTGIGLATVQRVIRRHLGRVWAEAAPGQGARLYFTLPQRAVERPALGASEGEAATPVPEGSSIGDNASLMQKR